MSLINSLKVTLVVAHRLHQFREKSPLEASYSLGVSIDELGSIPCQVVECLEVFIKTLVALGELHKLSMLNGHETRRDKVSSESCLKLTPNYLDVCREGGLVMCPPDACRALELVSCICGLHTFSQMEQSKPLLYRAQPIISL